MARNGMVILAEDLARFEAGLDVLRTGANARLALLADRGARRIASAGHLDGVEPTALASLAVLDRDAGDAQAATVERLQITGEDIDALFGQGA